MIQNCQLAIQAHEQHREEARKNGTLVDDDEDEKKRRKSAKSKLKSSKMKKSSKDTDNGMSGTDKRTDGANFSPRSPRPPSGSPRSAARDSPRGFPHSRSGTVQAGSVLGPGLGTGGGGHGRPGTAKGFRGSSEPGSAAGWDGFAGPPGPSGYGNDQQGEDADGQGGGGRESARAAIITVRQTHLLFASLHVSFPKALHSCLCVL